MKIKISILVFVFTMLLNACVYAAISDFPINDNVYRGENFQYIHPIYTGEDYDIIYVEKLQK